VPSGGICDEGRRGRGRFALELGCDVALVQRP